MRRLYLLCTGFILSLFFSQTSAQNEVANFTFTINGNSVHFTNTSNTPPADTAMRRCRWEFGDGTSLLAHYSTNPTHTYSQYGTYSACLKLFKVIPISTPNGDSLLLLSSICKTFILTGPDSCTANFESVATTNNTLGRYFMAQPWHNNQKKPERVCWTFGDGTDTCINYNPSQPPPNGYSVYHSYSQPGSYTACVTIRYQGGCEAHYCRTLQVGQADSCTAYFQSTSTSGSILTKHFSAVPWHNNNKRVTKVCWNFGDGSDTCIQYSNTYTGPYTINHTYSAPGQYNVCVKIFYEGGCEAMYCQLIQVGNNSTCTADFETAATSPTILSKHFTAIPWHSNQNKPVYICWNFGDGTDTCIQYSNTYPGPYTVTHTYAAAGQYNVCVRIVYAGGCEAIKCKLVSVGDANTCLADFERIPVSVAGTPLLASFKALPWHSSNKKPSRICWQFGDNRDTCIDYPENYTGQYTVTHAYSQPGQYQVCVKIIYYGGCEATKCKQITVEQPGSCHAQIYQVIPSITSLTRGFHVITTSTSNSPIQKICWNFGDGSDTCVYATNTNPVPPQFISHTFPGPGVYHTCVRVVYVNGCVAEHCVEVLIRSTNGICGGYITDSLAPPRTVHFRGFSIHNPNDNVVNYKWTFGDGTIAFGQNAVHTYPQNGIYTACLLITTAQGCETRICKRIVLGSTTNTPALQLSPNPVINNLHAVFYSTHTETVSIKIINSTGLTVRTYTRNATAGLNNWDFDLGTLPSGIYSFVVQSPNQLASAIFIKQ